VVARAHSHHAQPHLRDCSTLELIDTREDVTLSPESKGGLVITPRHFTKLLWKYTLVSFACVRLQCDWFVFRFSVVDRAAWHRQHLSGFDRQWPHLNNHSIVSDIRMRKAILLLLFTLADVCLGQYCSSAADATQYLKTNQTFIDLDCGFGIGWTIINWWAPPESLCQPCDFFETAYYAQGATLEGVKAIYNEFTCNALTNCLWNASAIHPLETTYSMSSGVCEFTGAGVTRINQNNETSLITDRGGNNRWWPVVLTKSTADGWLHCACVIIDSRDFNYTGLPPLR